MAVEADDLQQEVIDQSDSHQTRSGRLYIPHGYGEEKPFKPHISHQNVSYTECGPDWSSRLRWLPSPQPQDGQPYENEFYPPLKSIRHFPDVHNTSKMNEYSFYPPKGVMAPKGKGKQTIFDNQHKASATSQTELTENMIFGNRKIPDCLRNGISEASPGDKPYQAAEYSPGFHKLGSTRPIVNFGRKPVKTRLRTSVFFKDVITRAKPFMVKEAERRRNDEINVVKSLENWTPASPLVVPVLEPKSTA